MRNTEYGKSRATACTSEQGEIQLWKNGERNGDMCMEVWMGEEGKREYVPCMV